jgi:hypothetical protein
VVIRQLVDETAAEFDPPLPPGDAPAAAAVEQVSAHLSQFSRTHTCTRTPPTHTLSPTHTPHT